MAKVTIRGRDGDLISLEVLRRRVSNAADYWDGNWVDAEVSLRIRPWEASYQAYLRTEEFARFRGELENLYEGTTDRASFEPVEPWINISLERDALGHVHLRGEAGPEGFGRLFGQTRLVIEARDYSDQTYLPEVIAQLKALEIEFPVIGQPDTR